MLISALAERIPLAEMERTRRPARSAPEPWILALLIVVGAVLRFTTLASQSYWFDEAQAAHEFSLSLGAMFHSMIVHETNPPLYFVLGWVWAKVFGNGEAGLRSLSALAGLRASSRSRTCAVGSSSRAAPGSSRPRSRP